CLLARSDDLTSTRQVLVLIKTQHIFLLIVQILLFKTRSKSSKKQIINQHPDTLFIVFMAIANVHFDEYLLVRKNLLISSKSIKP
ncbi:transcriptional regulator RcsA, partial [Salmonella enterica subsp. enterica serovar Montevideo]|nr:transcriptional regulator RcsA [Salmonella enterica subsp. enterica serovar Montevideo]